MRSSGDRELENFKTQIDLREYAASVGYQLVRKQSSRRTAVMKHTSGEKIIIVRKPSNHYVYMNAHGNDQGSIIDFVQARDGGSLGSVRRTLRAFGGSTIHEFSPSRENTTPLLPKLEISDNDQADVLLAWTKAEPISGTHRYLNEARGIPDAVLNDPIFQDRIRTDHRGNALFPHFDQSGICGFEIKNHRFTGFSPGGRKAVMCSRPQATDRTIIICETAVDLLSVAALEGTEGKRFFSLAGQPSPLQIDLLKSAAAKMPQPSTVWIAVDNDAAGQRLSGFLHEELATSCQSIVNHVPPNPGDDWNDVLLQTRSVVTPHFSRSVSP